MPAQPTLECIKARPPQRSFLRIRGGSLFVLAVLALAELCFASVAGDERWFLPLIIGITYAVLIAAAFLVSRTHSRMGVISLEIFPPWRKQLAWPLLLFPILILPLPPTAGHYTCPHGTRWANNFIGIAHSSNGGPCRNDAHAPGIVWHLTGSWYLFIPVHP